MSHILMICLCQHKSDYIDDQHESEEDDSQFEISEVLVKLNPW